MKIIITIIILLLFLNCSQQKEEITIEKSETIIIDPDKYEKNNDISNILNDSIKIIQLETNDKCLIGNINKIELKNNKIFISDPINQKIFVFDIDGKFLRSIGKKGNGPGEIRNLGDFTFVGDSLLIQDGYARKYLIYNTEGDYLGDLPYKIHHHDVISFDNILYFVSNYYLSDLGFNNLFRYDINSKKIISYIPFDKKIQQNQLAWGLNRHTSKYRESAFLLYPLNDTIYEVTKNNVHPKYIIKFSKRNIPDNIKDKDGSTVFSLALRDGYIIGLDYIQNSNKHLFGTYGEGNRYRFITLNKETLQYKIGEKLTISNYGGFLLTNYYTTSNNELISVQDANILIDLWESSYSKNKFKNQKDKDKLKNIVGLINEESNPIIFVFKFE